MTASRSKSLVCGECGSEYEVRKKAGMRGPGSFLCQVCGEELFLWVCEENDDYDFHLIRSGKSLPSDKSPAVSPEKRAMAGFMDTSRLTPVASIEGEDEEETSLLRAMLTEARGYIRSFRWCPKISEEYLGFGIGKVLGLFLFHFAEPIGETDEYLWVVVGDLPSAFFVIDDAPNPRSAAEVYCRMMQAWINAVSSKAPLDDVFPVKADATDEMAQMLDTRLRFIREKIIPMIPSRAECESDVSTYQPGLNRSGGEGSDPV